MDKRKIKRKVKKYYWIIILAVSIFVAMWIYGMAGHYFPEPLHLGLGQYIDLAAGITIIGLLLSAVIVTIVFRKNKKEIGTGEYLTLKRIEKKKK